ncbi:MAG: homocysteine S-methyltransferase family protein [Clostridia bacterium]|nr:homocysteine S-methyltransferase family protein [Clostridia bacterium]
MNILEYMQEHLIYLDGGMGTLLQAAGMQAGELPERRNITHPDDIVAIHRAYYDAGSHIVNTNTFGANTLKYSIEELQAIIPAAVANARKAAAQSVAPQQKFVALDIGSLGRLIKPYGTLEFDEAVGIFATSVRIGTACGVDLVTIETMNDSLETKAALLAVKESCDLPVFVSNAYGADGKLMTGADPAAMIAMLEGLGADAIGINCSLGPKQMQTVVESYLTYASVPVLIKPNAGLPRCEGDRTYYDVAPDEFAALMQEFVQKGARVVGGCCGTTPDYIEALHQATCDLPLVQKDAAPKTMIGSYNHAVIFDGTPIAVGKSIDPAANASVAAALQDEDIDSIVDEAFEDIAEGARVLQVCVAADGIDETDLLCETVKELQTVINVPLWLRSKDASALERALRAYNGKAMISAADQSLQTLADLLGVAKKYGAVVALSNSSEEGARIARDAGFSQADILIVNDDTVEFV